MCGAGLWDCATGGGCVRAFCECCDDRRWFERAGVVDFRPALDVQLVLFVCQVCEASVSRPANGLSRMWIEDNLEDVGRGYGTVGMLERRRGRLIVNG